MGTPQGKIDLVLRALRRLEGNHTKAHLGGYYEMSAYANQYAYKTKSPDKERLRYYAKVIYRILHNCLTLFKKDVTIKYNLKSAKRLATVFDLQFEAFSKQDDHLMK